MAAIVTLVFLGISQSNRVFTVPTATLYSVNLGRDKTFYRDSVTNHPIGFVLLFFDTDGLADLVEGASLSAHPFVVPLYLHT